MPAARTPARRVAVGTPVAATGSPQGSPGASPGEGTPARGVYRGFLGSAPGASPTATPARARRSSAGVSPSASPAAQSMTMDDGSSSIYGTNVNEAEITAEFHRFLNDFKERPDEDSFYLNQMQQKWNDQSSVGIKLEVSGKHVNTFSKRLYQLLVAYPTEVVPFFDRELWHTAEKVLELDLAQSQQLLAQVKIFDLEDVDKRIMRLMNPTSDIERLVSLEGIIIRCSDTVPDMQSGLFCCSECKNEVMVALSHWTIDEPTRCENCGRAQTFQIVHNDCKFGDRQLLKLQESPDSVPEGETPQSVAVHCYDDLVDSVRPGDRVTVTGIYRASAVRPLRGFSKCAAVYRTHLDSICIVPQEEGRIDSPPDQRELSAAFNPRLAEKAYLDAGTLSEEDIKWNRIVYDLALEQDEEGQRTIVDKLIQSFAPSIYEEHEVKKGLLCQLFSGTPKAASRTTKQRFRPEINSLLCGDPSTAKSQLMQYAYKLAPRAVYTSGKGSSAVGLTASINKDPVTKDLVLESGALVLADRGMCCIDEFDKMDENARSILHEAMESQTVSVAKAGIVCSLNARTAILASANPKDSSYDPKKGVADNINLPKNLMTRFDLIWLMLDKRNKDMDRQLGEHLVSMYSEAGAKKRAAPPVSAELFRRYISFAKRYVFPRLSKEASEHLVQGYTDLRNQGGSREIITATPRILESLIRISESLAKMELREEVTKEDVAEAIRLLKAATYAAAIDPETGLIDMDQLIVGVGAGRRRRTKDMDNLMEEALAEKGGDGGLTADQLTMEINERLGSKKENLMSAAEFAAALRRMEEEGKIRRRGNKIELRG